MLGRQDRSRGWAPGLCRWVRRCGLPLLLLAAGWGLWRTGMHMPVPLAVSVRPNPHDHDALILKCQGHAPYAQLAPGGAALVWSAEWPEYRLSGPERQSVGMATDARRRRQQWAMAFWDCRTRRVTRTLPDPTGEANVAFFPDGRTAAFYDHRTRCLTFRELPGGRLLRRTPVLAPVRALCPSPDGRLLTGHFWEIGRAPTATAIWDVASGRRLPLPPSRHHFSIAFSPNGRMVAAGTGAWYVPYRVSIYDTLARQAKWSMLSGSIHIPAGGLDLLFSPDGEVLAGETYSEVAVWSLGTGRMIRRFAPGPHHDSTNAFLFSSDGHSLLHDGWLVDLRQPDTAPRQLFPSSRGMWYLSRYPGRPDQHLFVSDRATLELWDIRLAKRLRTWGVPVGESVVDFDPTSGLLLLRYDNGEWGLKRLR